MGFGGILTTILVVSTMYQVAEQAKKSGFLWGGIALALVVGQEYFFDTPRMIAALVSGGICAVVFTLYRVKTEY